MNYFFKQPVNQPINQRAAKPWQNLLMVLMVILLLSTHATIAIAETTTPLTGPLPLPLSAPPEATTNRPAAAIQIYTLGVQIAPMLPQLLGFDEPQSYLLLLQNNQELRATGGFITAIGRITLDKGAITELVFEDSYAVARHDVDHPLAPEPIKKYMGIEILFLRDINWSPDFPTTARLASSLYAQDAGVQVNGVITVDLSAVELFVDALAPLYIEGSDVPLTGANIIEQIMHFWDRPPTSEIDDEVETDTLFERGDWLFQRKDFIPLIAEAAMDRIESRSFSPVEVLNNVAAALNQRSVQVWLADANAAELFAQQQWDGALYPEAGADYVALIDTNMGYNKADAVLERALSHTVSWPDGPDAPAHATTTVTYHHPITEPDESCSPWTDYRTLQSYSAMIPRCYFGYVRLYVPGGSELIAIDGVEPDSVYSQAGERGTQVFAGYHSVEPSETHTVTFTYTLPPTITPDHYQLVLQRQSGSKPLPLHITVEETSFDLPLVDGTLIWPLPQPAITAKP